MSSAMLATERLHMVQIWLRMRRLVELARALKLPIENTDENYIVHCAIKELFGSQAPHLFSLEGNDGRYLRVLAYSRKTADELRHASEAAASPMVFEVCDWSRIASKTMPQEFQEGCRLQFNVRVCPVVRKASEGKYHKAGTEVDVFLSKVWEVNDSSVYLSREEVYLEWLQRQFRRQGGAKLVEGRLERFCLERLYRRTQGEHRKGKILKRPTATFDGHIEVADSALFISLLSSGIGRHKKLGFGMLRVRPPRS